MTGHLSCFFNVLLAKGVPHSGWWHTDNCVSTALSDESWPRVVEKLEGFHAGNWANDFSSCKFNRQLVEACWHYSIPLDLTEKLAMLGFLDPRISSRSQYKLDYRHKAEAQTRTMNIFHKVFVFSQEEVRCNSKKESPRHSSWRLWCGCPEILNYSSSEEEKRIKPTAKTLQGTNSREVPKAFNNPSC